MDDLHCTVAHRSRTSCEASRVARRSFDRAAQCIDVERAAEPHGARHVVRREPRRRAIEQPQQLLRERHRHHVANRCAARCRPRSSIRAVRHRSLSRRRPRVRRSTAAASCSPSAPRTASRSGSRTPNALLILPSTRMASSECPPSARKLSVTPTCSRLSTSAQIAASCVSVAVRGATNARLSGSPRRGSGSFARSTLPFARQRQRVEQHDRARHHVLRQLRARATR